MNDQELEQLAVQLAALPEYERERVFWRTRAISHAKRAMGHRLAGTVPSRWGDLMVGGLIYDADGQALCRVKHLDVRKEAAEDHRGYTGKTVTRIYITAYREDE